jgi:hypothetical protein
MINLVQSFVRKGVVFFPINEAPQSSNNVTFLLTFSNTKPLGTHLTNIRFHNSTRIVTNYAVSGIKDERVVLYNIVLGMRMNA